jgi:hypothetical protein
VAGVEAAGGTIGIGIRGYSFGSCRLDFLRNLRLHALLRHRCGCCWVVFFIFARRDRRDWRSAVVAC